MAISSNTKTKIIAKCISVMIIGSISFSIVVRFLPGHCYSVLSFLCFEARAWQGQPRSCYFRWLYVMFLTPQQDLLIIVPYQSMAGSLYFAPIQTVTLVVEEEEAAHCRPPAPPCNTGDVPSSTASSIDQQWSFCGCSRSGTTIYLLSGIIY